MADIRDSDLNRKTPIFIGIKITWKPTKPTSVTQSNQLNTKVTKLTRARGDFNATNQSSWGTSNTLAIGPLTDDVTLNNDVTRERERTSPNSSNSANLEAVAKQQTRDQSATGGWMGPIRKRRGLVVEEPMNTAVRERLRDAPGSYLSSTATEGPWARGGCLRAR